MRSIYVKDNFLKNCYKISFHNNYSILIKFLRITNKESLTFYYEYRSICPLEQYNYNFQINKCHET